MQTKKLYRYYFLKNSMILPPIINSTVRKARKQLIYQHSYFNTTGKEKLIHVSIFKKYISSAL